MTRAELDALHDDGRRHELIDGVLVVTPVPPIRHQFAVGGLFRLLDPVCPKGVVLILGPFDIALADDTVLEPDLLVAPREQFTERDLPGAPLLAIEILSPSTRLVDLTLKKTRYEAAGCPSYWVFDPDRVELTAWELVDGAYGPPTVVVGDQVFRMERPFAVEVVPSRLLEL